MSSLAYVLAIQRVAIIVYCMHICIINYNQSGCLRRCSNLIVLDTYFLQSVILHFEFPMIWQCHQFRFWQRQSVSGHIVCESHTYEFILYFYSVVVAARLLAKLIESRFIPMGVRLMRKWNAQRQLTRAHCVLYEQIQMYRYNNNNNNRGRIASW